VIIPEVRMPADLSSRLDERITVWYLRHMASTAFVR
jgi:hypothetical protein